MQKRLTSKLPISVAFHKKLTQPGAEGEAPRTANEVQTNQICTALIKVRAS
jgi:hypothetical protein